MKRNTGIALLLLAAANGFAGTMGAVCNTGGEVTVPCALYGWAFNFQLLYLKPVYADNAYLTEYEPPLYSFAKLYPHWGYGFVLGGAYNFGMGNDFKVHWYHYSQTTYRTIYTATRVATEQVLFTELRPKWDALNLEFGQLVWFKPQYSMRLHMGGQYARISNDYYAHTERMPLPDAIHTSFNGFGPRAGMELEYNFDEHYAIYAKYAGAVFAGRPEYHTVTRGIIDAPARTTFDQLQTSAELEGKLGGRVRFNLAQGDFDVDVGYLVTQYFHTQLYRTLNGDSHAMDFGLYGIYLRLNYLGYI